MAPWNYPLSLALMPLATALAAGNRAMIKPSEFTPATSDLLARMLAQIFPQEQVAVVTGDASVGASFAALPFDHLIFTGSTSVGRAVMKSASENLTPVTLELGGKSPVIVAKGHALDSVAAGIAFGKLSNGGQTCIAPDYALVHEDDIESFTAAYNKAVTALYPNGPASDDYTSIINDRHFARLTRLLDDARAKGARILEVGQNTGDAGRRSHTLAPMIVLNANDEMQIMQGRDLWTGPAGAFIPGPRRGHRVCQRTASAAGALLLRTGWRTEAQGVEPHDLRQCHDQRDAHALRTGRSAFRRCRSQRHGAFITVSKASAGSVMPRAYLSRADGTAPICCAPPSGR